VRSVITYGTLPPIEGKVSANRHDRESASIAVRKVGLSPTTYQRAKTILEEASEELKEKVRGGKTSIAYACKMLKRKQPAGLPALPDGEFDVIYADPPWDYARAAHSKRTRKPQSSRSANSNSYAHPSYSLEVPDH